MNICLYNGESRLYGTEKIGAEETALKLIVKRYFTFHVGCVAAWLVYDKKTGNGEALAVGRFTPKPHARKHLAKMGIGVAPVGAQFQELLLVHGPQGLRWNGREVVANGN